MKFKPGDIVRIRDWDDMAAEYYIDEDGDIRVRLGVYFVKAMRKFCGDTLTVSECNLVSDEDICVWFEEDYDGLSNYYMYEEFLEPVTSQPEPITEIDFSVLSGLILGFT